MSTVLVDRDASTPTMGLLTCHMTFAYTYAHKHLEMKEMNGYIMIYILVIHALRSGMMLTADARLTATVMASGPVQRASIARDKVRPSPIIVCFVYSRVA